MSVNLIPLLLITAVLLALPSLSRRTVPLGVSVPTTRLDEPVVHRSMLRYRVGVLVSAGVVVALVVLLTPAAAAVADNAAPFVLLVAAGAVFGWARRPILRAKHAGGWYDGVPVRIIARLTDGSAAGAGSLALVLALPGRGGVAGAIVGAVLYDRQPDPYPMHWNGSGAAEFVRRRSPSLTVFAPVAVMLGVVVLMAVIAVAGGSGCRSAGTPTGTLRGAERRRVAVQGSVQNPGSAC